MIKLAKEYNWKISNIDCISIIGQVRNLLIHPKISKKENNIKITETMMQELFVIAHN